MTIVGFISGYYRCGTTIFQRYVQEVVPKYVVLCEPTQHEIVRHIMSYGCIRTHPLHGFPVFEPYLKLRNEVLVNFIVRHHKVFDKSTKHWGVIDDPSVAIYLLEPFDDLTNVEIVIKTNQLWTCIDEVAKAFDAWVIALTRPVDKIVESHFPDKASLERAKRMHFPPPFYASLVYERLIGDPKGKTAYDIVRECAELYVRTTARKFGGRAVNFDDFVLNPSKYADSIKPVPLNLRAHAKIFDVRRL